MNHNVGKIFLCMIMKLFLLMFVPFKMIRLRTKIKKSYQYFQIRIQPAIITLCFLLLSHFFFNYHVNIIC